MKLNSIQCLRAFAAILVVYQHFINQPIKQASSWQQSITNLKTFGSIGVDLFFIISGFIIMYIANKHIGFVDGINFLTRRLCRINPIYYITTLLYLGVLLFAQKLGYNIHLVSSSEIILNSLIDTLLILPTSNDVYSFSPLMIIGWTLSFECFFYLLFFIIITLKVKRKSLHLLSLICLLIVLGQIFKPTDYRLIFITNPIFLEFLLGVLLYSMYIKYSAIPLYIPFSLILIGLIGYVLLFVYGSGEIWHYSGVLSGQHSLKRFILWGIPSSFFVAGCVFLEKCKKFDYLFANPWFRYMGDASYSIYLVHPIAFTILLVAFNRIGYFLPMDLIILLEVIIAVTLSICFYKYIEKPLLHYLSELNFWNRMNTAKSN